MITSNHFSTIPSKGIVNLSGNKELMPLDALHIILFRMAKKNAWNIVELPFTANAVIEALQFIGKEPSKKERELITLLDQISNETISVIYHKRHFMVKINNTIYVLDIPFSRFFERIKLWEAYWSHKAPL